MRFFVSTIIFFLFNFCISFAEVIRYDDDEVVEDFLVLPNEQRDHSFNVRFTPAEAPFELTGAQIALFDNYGDAGNPGMRVSFGLSENGHPHRDLLDSLDIVGDNLVFSAEEIIWNEIDLSRFELLFNARMDFHIIVNVLQNDEWDTLAVFVDSGEFQPTNRSGLWSTEEQDWVHLIDLFGMGYNFLIRAVVRYGVEDNVGNETDILRPSESSLHACYPNPFNSTLNIPFSLKNSDIVSIGIYDVQGSFVSGITRDHFERGFYNSVWEADKFNAGVYYIKFTTTNLSKARKVVLLK